MDTATTARWRRIDTLFHQVSELDTGARDAFLLEVCGDDAELRAELDSLLNASGQTLRSMRDAVVSAAGEILEEETELIEKIGAYKVLRTLGEGGMGTVYLAARDDAQYERLVAIKVMRAGLSRSPAMQLLFRSERQILADLDHPNIARMLDGGITPNGSPYLVMEYIDGTAVDAYCNQHNLSLDQRLALFSSLLGAVVYAQQHLVVHRDIKPMNVLVTNDGTPKLLDFGISKLMDTSREQAAREPSDPEHPEPERTDRVRLLTPDYASPEQLLGQPVSTATDVYALGSLLYELLTSRLPCGAAAQSAPERARAICEEQPQPASSVCLRTHALPRPEAHRLRGDIDSILLKALRKNPSERYPGAAQFLSDFDRYREGRPVSAVTPNVPYVLGKFLRRHRLGVAAAAAVALMIVGFGIGMGVLARRARLGEAKARREGAFLSNIFQAATPEASKGETVTAKQLLDQAVARLDNEMGDDLELRASLSEDMGQSYAALGLYDKSQPLLQRALDLTSQTKGEKNSAYVDDLANLANNFRLQGQYENAEPLMRKALTLNLSLHPQRSLAVAHSMSMLGECLYWEDKDSEAEPMLRQALATERSLDPNYLDGTRSYLALELERKGQFKEAADLLKESTALTARINGRESQEYLVSLHNLAGAQIDAGDLEGAIRSDSEALATRRRIWGHDHPDTAYSLNNLGYIYLEQGRWQLAEPMLQENLAIAARLSGGTSPRHAIALANMGRVNEQSGDYAAAASFYQQGQQVLAAGGKSQSWFGARILVYQSMLEADRGHFTEAVRIARQATDLQQKLGGPDSPQLASGLLALGLAQLLDGNPESAETAFRSALKIRNSAYPPTHPEVLIVQARLAETLLARNQPKPALDVVNAAIANAQSAPYPMPNWRIAELRVVEGLAMNQIARNGESQALLSANRAGLDNYNQPAVRDFLFKRVESAQAPPPKSK